MQAMRVYRLADGPTKSRLYLDGRRVNELAWETAHIWRRTDCYASRMETRPDGSVLVRQFHSIRPRG